MTFLNRIAHLPTPDQAPHDWKHLNGVVSLAAGQDVNSANITTGEPPRASIGATFDNLRLNMAAEDRALWCFMRPLGRPSFTVDLLSDLRRMQAIINGMFRRSAAPADRPFDTFVLASDSPGVFNLGGDLQLFSRKIQDQDVDALRSYAYACVEALYDNYRGYENRVVTIALVQGDALGGGLEAALSCDMIVAERGTKFGLPEILFNLFPGMGAYSYLSRRIGAAKAEEMILSGNLYTAEDMHRMGVVDLLAEPGEGAQAVREHIASTRTRRNARASVYEVRRRVNPVTLDELRDVTDIWVESALRLSEADLRVMTRLAGAQDRSRQRRHAALAAAE